MTQFDLLSAVQPAGGWYAVLGIKGGDNIRQHLVETREEVDALAQQLVQNEWNVFFGVAKYKDDSGRKKTNVHALKSLWLDIDCGPSKTIINQKTKKPQGYATQEDGLNALKAFTNKIGLPKPIVVNSGRGLHVYWPTIEELTPAEWEPIADRLRELCNTHDLHVDPVVFETARILRIPGTFNFKDNPPLEVKVMVMGKPTPVAELRKILGVRERIVQGLFGPKKERGPTALGEALKQNITNSFSRIMVRSAQNVGCQQLLDCYKSRSTLSEARWFDALSVAKFCKDKDTAIHKLSAGHPEYDPAKTEQKISHIQGPHNCATFERNNPGGCAGCPHLGKIKNPIVLGAEVEEAEHHNGMYTVHQQSDDGEEILEYEAPIYPDPYVRGKNGGVWKKAKEPEEEPMLIYHDDLYVVKRMSDPRVGGVVLVRHHTPRDGVKEFTLNNATVTDAAELRKILSANDVLCHPKQFGLVAEYLLSSMMAMRKEQKAELMRLQFGWADKDTKFIVGSQEITVDGTFYSPPSSVTEELAELFGPVGSYEKWKEVFELYGRPGLEPHAFAALTAFGAPLLKFTGQSGAIINVIHPFSGTGKTTILHMCNSVWGDPKNLCATQKDTENAKITKLGVYCNLPYCVDEITNMKPAAFSDLIYGMANGKGKDRMESSGNKLRSNHTKWQTISLCSSNASFYEKLGVAKNSPDGEMMRMIEYKIEYSDALDMEHAKQMFDHQLLENYGHAGPIFIAWCIANREEAINLLRAVQSKFDRELKLTQRERFWSAVIAANITAGIICRKLDIIDWDMKRIYAFAASKIAELREDVRPPVSDAAAVLGDYLNRHIHNILVVDAGNDKRTGKELFPKMEPRGELLIRYEPDTKLLYLTGKDFKNDCAAYQISYKETMAELKKKGLFIGSDTKRLSKGMKITTLPVYVIIIDTSTEDFISMEGLIDPEIKAIETGADEAVTDDAGGGS
jgi:hypothetical protein